MGERGARQVFISTHRLHRWIDGFAERHPVPGHSTPEHPGLAQPGLSAARPDEHTLALTAPDGAQAWLSTPWFPEPVGPGPAITTFAAHCQRPRRIAVLLVRRGGYAAGIFEAARLVASKVGSSYVQGTTKAGGWSQQRYARRRANQTAAAFAAAADVAARVLLPEAAGVSALVRGGDGAAVSAVLAEARLAPLAALPTGPVIDVPDPRLKVLAAMPERFGLIRIDLTP